MPPKPKFTKDQLIQASLKIVREEGEAALTARRLAEELGTSPRPIFTVFEGMNELKLALVEPAYEIFNNHFTGYQDYYPAFKRFGMLLVDFAEKEPHLFSFLMMGKHGQPKSLSEWAHSAIGDEAIETLKEATDLDDENARLLFEEIWLHTFSLCVLKVTGAAVLTEEEVSVSLSRSYLGLYSLAKAGLLHELHPPQLEAAQSMGPATIPIQLLSPAR